QRGFATADLLSLEGEDLHTMPEIIAHHPADHTKVRVLRQNKISEIEPLLVEVYRQGTQVYEAPDLAGLRERRDADLARLDSGVLRLINPHIYHVSLTEQLWNMKQQVIADAQKQSH